MGQNRASSATAGRNCHLDCKGELEGVIEKGSILVHYRKSSTLYGESVLRNILKVEIVAGDLYDNEAHTLKTILEEHWHHLPEAEVIDFLGTASDRGLHTFEVGHRQKLFGPNTITQKKGRSPIILFLLQFHQPLVYFLLAAAALPLASQFPVQARPVQQTAARWEASP